MLWNKKDYNVIRLYKTEKIQCNHCNGTGKCDCGKNIKLPDMTQYNRLIYGPYAYKSEENGKSLLPAKYDMRSSQEIIGKFCLGNYCYACDGTGYIMEQNYQDVIQTNQK